MADIVIKQIEEGMTGRQVADLLYSNFLALVGAIGSGVGGDIPVADIEKGVTAYGWGDHRQAGYLKGITAGMVTGALGYTPMDEAAWTKANIKATLGIADWALAASKPTYKTNEVAEDGNMYFTDARAVAALKSVTDGLSGNISTLQGYFTDGVANSALKLSDNGSYTAWGQTFFANGKPKSVSGALTDVTDIISSGTITTNKIVIGNGTIEWDETNKGFKVTGLYSTTYLSAKGANSSGGSSSDGGLITSLYRYADLGKTFSDTNNDTFNAYTINKINADLGSRISVLEGKATNVSFTQSLTSGTQIGSISIDGVTKNIYAPTIPTSDINKGVTAHGWGNHATMGYITASASITGNAASASLIKPTTGTGKASTWTPLTSYTRIWGESFNVSSLGSDTGDIVFYLRNGVYTSNSEELCVAIDGDFYAQTGSKKVLHEGNYTDYAYSKSQVDSTLSGYLPLSGGTLTKSENILSLNSTTGNAWIYFKSSNVNKASVGYYNNLSSVANEASGGRIGVNDSGVPQYWNNANGSLKYDLIHSGNIGSQSVASAAKLTTARTIWGKSFDGTGNVSGGLINADYIRSNSTNGYYVGDRVSAVGGTENGLALFAYGATPITLHTSSIERARILANGNVLIGIATDSDGKLQVSGKIKLTDWDADGTAIRLENPNRGKALISSYAIGNNAYTFGQDGASFIISHNSYGSVFNIISGNVGIGTTSPAQKLDVNGEILIHNFHALMSRKTDGTQINLIYCGNDDVIKIGGALPIKLQGNTTITGTLNMNAAAMGLGGAIDFQFSDEINRYGGNLYIQHRGDGSQTGTVSGATGNVVMCKNGGNVLIGTGTDNGCKLDVNGVINTNSRIYTPYIFMGKDREGVYISDNVLSWHNASNVYVKSIIEFTGGLLKFVQPTTINSTLDVNSTLHASGAVSFDSILSVGGTALINGNAAIGGNSDGNRLYVFGVVRSAAYNAIGNNNAAFVFDKPGTNYTGIGANGVTDTIYFGACNTSGAWITDYYQKWHFNGTIYGKVGIWSDGYVSAKGQNTSSDMRLKNVLNDVVLSVKDIANAPSIRFAWKNGGGVDVGSSAQYWQKLLPDAVKERDGMLEMQYANIALLSAIALAKRSESHEERLKRLEKENIELKQRIVILEGGNYA